MDENKDAMKKHLPIYIEPSVIGGLLLFRIRKRRFANSFADRQTC
jgi:hypothetical protein